MPDKFALQAPRPRARRFAPVAAIALAAAFALVAPAARATGGALVVVVNASRAEKDVAVSELRKIFVGEKKFWADGRRIQPILPPLSDENSKNKFLKVVVKQNDRDFRQEWEGKIFRGDAQAMPVRPMETSMVVSAARSVPGAIGVLDRAEFEKLAKDSTTGLRVLSVDGKSPDDDGYPLN